jgi:hypothetical protein
MAKKEKNVARESENESESESESESEDESDDDEFNQHLARLSKKDKLMVLKLVEKIGEQEETLYKQDELLIKKIKCLEKLTKEHEKLKCSHASLVKRYENLSIEQTRTIDSLCCVAKLEDENYMLKDKVERLTSRNEILRENHDELLCSHEKLMDSHLMLEIAHEVVVTTVKSYQPHTHKCTCTQVPFILSCANNCCSQASQPSVEHVLVENCDDYIAKENEQLKEEVERLRRDLIYWKGKCNAQPSQDNCEDMVKKLEKGSTVACTKPHQQSHKSNYGKVMEKMEKVQSVQNTQCGSAAPKCDSAAPGQNSKTPMATKVQLQPKKTPITCFKCKKEGHHVRDCTLKKERKGMSKIQERKKMTHVKCSNLGHNASMCSNNVDDQATLPKNKTRRSKRKCYGCNEKGHEIASCPSMKDESLASSTKRLVSEVANKKQDKKMSYKIKRHICYTCRGKGHLSMDCPMGNTPKLNSTIDSNMLRRPKNDTCARKVIGSPRASTKAIWVPKSLVTNLNGPNMVWVPSCA